MFVDESKAGVAREKGGGAWGVCSGERRKKSYPGENSRRQSSSIMVLFNGWGGEERGWAVGKGCEGARFSSALGGRKEGLETILFAGEAQPAN